MENTTSVVALDKTLIGVVVGTDDEERRERGGILEEEESGGWSRRSDVSHSAWQKEERMFCCWDPA